MGVLYNALVGVVCIDLGVVLTLMPRCVCVAYNALVGVVSFHAQIHETVDQINAIKLQRDFYLGFAQNPQVWEETSVYIVHCHYNVHVKHFASCMFKRCCLVYCDYCQYILVCYQYYSCILSVYSCILSVYSGTLSVYSSTLILYTNVHHVRIILFSIEIHQRLDGLTKQRPQSNPTIITSQSHIVPLVFRS